MSARVTSGWYVRSYTTALTFKLAQVTIVAISALGLGCVKTLTLSACVEKSRTDCATVGQMIPRTDRSMPCGSIVFSTFCRRMSFYTARVMSSKARDEYSSSGSEAAA